MLYKKHQDIVQEPGMHPSSISEPGQLVLFSQCNPLQRVTQSFGRSCTEPDILWPLSHAPLPYPPHDLTGIQWQSNALQHTQK